MALWLRDMPFSISAGIGFIALSGVAVLGDMVLVSHVLRLLGRGREPLRAIEEAAVNAGTSTMFQQALKKAAAGTTSFEEVYRVVADA